MRERYVGPQPATAFPLPPLFLLALGDGFDIGRCGRKQGATKWRQGRVARRSTRWMMGHNEMVTRESVTEVASGESARDSAPWNDELPNEDVEGLATNDLTHELEELTK